MTDLTGMIRWNANFVRGLAESVLNRAKVIRSSLTSATPAPVEAPKKSVAKKTASAKKALKSEAVKRATSKPRAKRTDT